MGRSSTASAAARPQRRDADTKLAQSRLSVPELSRELGSVAEACRQRGMDRTRPRRIGQPPIGGMAMMSADSSPESTPTSFSM